MSISLKRITCLLRCPACGVGPLYKGVLQPTEECLHCLHDFKAYEHADGPSYIVILLVSTLVTTAAAMVEVKIGWPLWLHAAVWLPMIPMLSIWWLHHARAWLIGMEYRHKQKDK